jgi:hypothetical protein
MKRLRRTLVIVCAAMLASACSLIGPGHLKADQVDYARALGEANKRAILASIVQLRYADAPSFVSVSQIIASYSFDASGGPTLNLGSGVQASYASAAGSVSYSNHPTFTFVPTTGEAFATAFIRPLAPALVLPLAQGGIPVDLLLRIAAQSIGDLSNGTALGGPGSAGSPAFFELLRAARRLQLEGDLNVESRNGNGASRVFLAIRNSADDPPGAAADRDALKRLLHLPADTGSFEVVYGQWAPPGQIAILTRSVLAVLSDLGAQIAVPDAEVAKGATKSTVPLIGGETRPTIIVRSGRSAPSNAYVTVSYRGTNYWIEQDDFDSKYAFTVVQDLMALAQVDTSAKAPIVTIPAD